MYPTKYQWSLKPKRVAMHLHHVQGSTAVTALLAAVTALLSPLCWLACERGEEARAELVHPSMRAEAAREAAVAPGRIAKQHHPRAAAAAQELRRVLVNIACADDRVVVGVDDERRHLVRATM